jgi:hypothetical protein
MKGMRGMEELSQNTEMMKNPKCQKLAGAIFMTIAYLWCTVFSFYAAFAAVFGVLYFGEWQPCFLYNPESGVVLDK